jgi:hypothetical protein
MIIMTMMIMRRVRMMKTKEMGKRLLKLKVKILKRKILN